MNSHIPKPRLEFSTPSHLWTSHKAVMQHVTTSVVDSQKLLGCCHRSHSLLADPSLAMKSRDSQLLYRGHYIHKEIFWVDQIQPLHFRDLPVSICTLFPFPILLQTATFSHTCNVVGLVEAEYNCVMGHLGVPDPQQLFLWGAHGCCMLETSLTDSFTQV